MLLMMGFMYTHIQTKLVKCSGWRKGELRLNEQSAGVLF